MTEEYTVSQNPGRTKSSRPRGKTPHRKRSPAKSDRLQDEIENALEPAVGGPAPRVDLEPSSLIRRQFTRDEWEYLQQLPSGSLAEEIRVMRVLSLRLVQQGLNADNPGDEIRYYSEATRIMARLPLLLKAEKALNSEQDDVTRAMIQAINAVLEEDQKKKAKQLELPLEDMD